MEMELNLKANKAVDSTESKTQSLSSFKSLKASRFELLKNFRSRYFLHDNGFVRSELIQSQNRKYSILKAEDLNEVCERTFDEFYRLYSCLKSEFPFIPMPKVTLKEKLIEKVKNNFEKNWQIEQKNELAYFINFCSNHEELRKSDGLVYFLSKQGGIDKVEPNPFYKVLSADMSTKFNTEFKDFFGKIFKGEKQDPNLNPVKTHTISDLEMKIKSREEYFNNSRNISLSSVIFLEKAIETKRKETNNLFDFSNSLISQVRSSENDSSDITSIPKEHLSSIKELALFQTNTENEVREMIESIKFLVRFQDAILQGFESYYSFLADIDKSLRYMVEQIEGGEKYSLKKQEENKGVIKEKKSFFEEHFSRELNNYERIVQTEISNLFVGVMDFKYLSNEKENDILFKSFTGMLTDLSERVVDVEIAKIR